MSALDIASLGDREERIAARRRRAQQKLRREKEETTKTEEDVDQGGKDPNRFGIQI